MEYNKIVAVTGLPGLFEIVSSKNDGAIVRSLDDKSTRFISSRIHNLSHLESIEVYTVRDNVSLSDIFTAMKESGTALPDVKDNKALKGYFEQAYPDLDFERVYSSDMKKMVKWFESLQANDIDFSAPAEAEETEALMDVENSAAAEPVAAAEEAPAEEAPKPKRTRKKKTEEE